MINNEAPEIRRYLVEIRPQLHLLPNSIDIEADDLLEAKKVNRELLLRRQIKPILPDHHVILIDTPPAMRAATVNALVVPDSVIIPIDSSSFGLLGMNQLLKTIAAISETHNPSLEIVVLTTLFNGRQNLDRERRQVEGFFDSSLVLETVIHRYVGVAEATAMRKGVVESSTTGAAMFDFMKLFNELKREMNHEQKGQGAVLWFPSDRSPGCGPCSSKARDQNVVAQHPDSTSAYAMPVRFPSATSNALGFDPLRLAL